MSERSNASDKILSGFTSPIEPVKKSASYNLGIFLTVVCLLAMPLIYLLIMITICGLSFLHLKYNTGIMEWQISGLGTIIKLFCYFGPAIGAVTMVIFMIKPLFKKIPKPCNTILLNYDDAPGFFNFVYAICKSVGAPKPTEIRLFNEVNAYASFVPGIRGILMGKLCLTVGLPLLSGLNTRELAGVIAHEFGHFAQGAGMRTTFLIRNITGFFYRVVYERDALDARIEEASQRVDIRIRIFILLARLFIWISRFFLEKVSYVGLLAGMYTMRKMEFDADRYEARLVGSEQFAKTSMAIHAIQYAWHFADQIAASMYNEEKTLPDNFGALVKYERQKISPEILSKISDEQMKKKTQKLDTHPCDAERIASAANENSPGNFTIEEDTRLLFSNFIKTAQACTQQYFLHVTGSDVSNTPSYNCDDYISYLKEVDTDFEASIRLFGTASNFLLPLTVNFNIENFTENNYEVLKQSAFETHEKLIEAEKAFDKALSHLLDIGAGSAVLNAGYTIKPDQFGFEDLPNDGGVGALNDAYEKLESARKTFNVESGDLEKWICYAYKQLSENEESRIEAEPVKSLCIFFQEQNGNIFSVFVANQQLSFILNQKEISSPKRENELIRLIDEIERRLKTIREASKSMTVPFARKDENRKLENYLFGPDFSSPRFREKFCHNTSKFIQNVNQLYLITYGRFMRQIESWELQTEVIA